MAFMSNLDISVSGMIAQRLRADIIAQNVANADTTRTAEGGPYVRQVVVFTEDSGYDNTKLDKYNFRSVLSSKLEELQGLKGKDRIETMEGVVATEVVDDPTPSTPVYDPTNPDADENGYYYMPNVDVTEEQIDMLAATQSYQANLTIFNSMKSLAQKALTIGQG